MAALEDKSHPDCPWESLEGRPNGQGQAEARSFLSYLDEPRLLIVGVGGCGCRWISQLAASNPQGVELIAADTDLSALHNCLAHRKLLLGEQLAGGQGTRGELLVGKAAAMESGEELRRHCRGAEVMVITYAPGGGTGSGAGPVIAEIGRQEGALCIAVVPMQDDQGRAESGDGIGSMARLSEAVDVLLGTPSAVVPASGASAQEGNVSIPTLLRSMVPHLGEESPFLAALREFAAGKKLSGQVFTAGRGPLEVLQAGAVEAVAGAGPLAQEGARLFLHVDGPQEMGSQVAGECAKQLRNRLPVEVVVTQRSVEAREDESSLIVCLALINGQEAAACGEEDAEERAAPPPPDAPEPLFDVREPRFVLAYGDLDRLGEEESASSAPVDSIPKDFLTRLRGAIDGILRDQGSACFAEVVELCEGSDRPSWSRQEVVEEILVSLCEVARRCLEGNYILSVKEKAVLGRVPPILAALSLDVETAATPAHVLVSELTALVAESENAPTLAQDTPLELFAEGSAVDMLVV
jgi:hypothetical protein